MGAAGRRTLLNIGIIGCGRVANGLHLPALEHVPEARVLALADVDAGRLQRVADAHGVPARHADHRALIDDPAIDAIAVCVPARQHAEIALEALDAGKHVLVEKPLALSIADADRLVDRAARSDRVAMVGFNLRWHPLVRQARSLITAGALGEISLFRSAMTGSARLQPDTPSWRLSRAEGGGAFLEQGVHHFDLCRVLLGTEVEEVFALSEADDAAATISLRTERGVLAGMSFSEATNPVNEIDVYGSAARIHVSCFRFDGLERASTASVGGDPRTRLSGVSRWLRAVASGVGHLRRGGVFRASYVDEWAHFARCVETGTPVEATLEDGRRALEIALAAAESASSGRPIQVARGRTQIA
jgi:myo-inositol 2-dehydrogenase/D-chiro-inositol 1-dehydrogenase